MRKTRLSGSGLLSLILLALITLTGCERAAEPLRLEAATVLNPGKALPEFQLKQWDAEREQEVDFSAGGLKGRWSLFFFGYTHCPDVCPTELYTLSGMMRKIEKSGDGSSVTAPQVVFVSVDPQRDTPESLQQYAGYYHPLFVGATGEQVEVDRLSRAMGAMYERVYYMDGRQLMIDEEEGVPEGLENSYLINHTASIFLINPKGELHAILSTPHQPDVMVRDLAAIQAAWD